MFFQNFNLALALIFCRSYCVIVLGSVAAGMWILSFDFSDPAMLVQNIFFGSITITFFAYVFSDFNTWLEEFRFLKAWYLDWIENQSDTTTLLLASLPFNIGTNFLQFLCIQYEQRFTNWSPEEVGATSLVIMNIATFYLLRKYIFRVKNKRYIWQIILYSLITGLAYLSTKFCLILLTAFLPLGTALLTFLTSAALGWIWFALHKAITFREEKVEIFAWLRRKKALNYISDS